jgi:hypothetical protein
VLARLHRAVWGFIETDLASRTVFFFLALSPQLLEHNKSWNNLFLLRRHFSHLVE